MTDNLLSKYETDSSCKIVLTSGEITLNHSIYKFVALPFEQIGFFFKIPISHNNIKRNFPKWTKLVISAVTSPSNSKQRQAMACLGKILRCPNSTQRAE